MKKLILLLLVLLPTVAWAGPGYMVHDSSTVPVAGCDPASNEIGFRSGTWIAATMGTGKARANLVVPDCSGPLNTAFVRHYSSNTENCIVLVALDDGDEVPDSGDTVIAYSGVISGSVTATWYSAAMSSTPNVSTSNKYWVVIVSEDAADWGFYYETAGVSQYYMSVSGWFSSPPANLGGTWLPNSTRQDAAYVTIGS